MKDSINQLVHKFEQKRPGIDLSLGRIFAFLAKLGSPHLHLNNVIHVAGTNGKGSTIAFLKAMLEADHKSCHVYTSPELVKYNERIQVNGKEITDSYLLQLLQRIDAASENEPLTSFELSTAAAFVAFAENKADFVLLETGLGGKLDATNVVPDTKMCLFTPISYDHMEFLGSSLAGIAAEKAGIIKDTAVCITAPQKPEVMEVLKSKAPDIMVADSDYNLPELPLAGAHQKINATLAMEAAKTIGLPERSIQKGLLNAKWKARLQKLTAGKLPPLLPPGIELRLDGAHNEAGAEVLAKYISESGKDWVMILGMMNSKDSRSYLKNFIGKVKAIYTVPIEGKDAKNQFELASLARSLSLNATPCSDATEAVQKALSIYKDKANIIITGSLYLAGKILEENS